MSDCRWPLGNGESLDFTVYEVPGTNWNDVAGLYIFAVNTSQNNWRALYVGQADSFKDRLSSHERWREAQLLGAKHIHALPIQLEANRDIFEELLIQNLQPQLNVQLR
jgi:excinuclease UvrABC nuclease subunit